MSSTNTDFNNKEKKGKRRTIAETKKRSEENLPQSPTHAVLNP